ncbi:MAG: ABC transporter ATP-binding protein [Spirochaetaceae bacterium]|jgi:oligopeptide/dipeptide ABC transporter ATP-binding protein|nr:ABC transporter ATP-binding protein [Spirochaetaceae bacterium]
MKSAVSGNPALIVTDLRKRFNLEAGFFAPLGKFVYAVNGISFTIGENESYGLVGESGCGKTTAARLLVRMYENSGGSILYRGETDVGSLNKKDLARYREKVKYVFQDPARSLNPRMSVFDVLVSGKRWSSAWRGKKEERSAAGAILGEVGLSPEDLERRPAEFSGGQRQRISIARGLLMEPELLICDEVVSALDVSVQGQILNLLMDIRARRGLSFLFIAHDLKVASWFCDRIGVMYRGELMEEAPAADLYKTALHPYTRLLFSSAPGRGAGAGISGAAGETGAMPDLLKGEVRTALSEIRGCPFAERCPRVRKRCLEEKPEFTERAPGRRVRCFDGG